MNYKIIKFIHNFSYAISSNLVSLAVSTLIILIVPKLIGVEEYGYWQLYLFYSSYVGFLHFGWSDGIYLRYGGKEYRELDRGIFCSQFYMMLFFQLIIAIFIYCISINFLEDENRIFIFQMVAVNLLIMNTLSILIFILQGTNRIKEYAQITILSRMLYIILILVLLAIGVREYRLLIVSDLVGKLVSLFYAVYCCRGIVFNKISCFYLSFRETLDNVNVGIKLMFANISSMLIIGVVRFGIERSWDISTFGRVSLTLGISNLMMLFINAVGTIIFPVLRRTSEDNLAKIYITMRDFLMIILLGSLILHYPLKSILSMWLTNYLESLAYMTLIFPIIVFEGKMALLINTYLKVLRHEKLILKINIISLSLSLIITFITTIMLKNLNYATISIVIILAFRCALAEIILSRILHISIYRDICLELIMTLVFISVGWFINSWYAVLVYLICYLIYLIIKRKDITSSVKNVKILTGV